MTNLKNIDANQEMQRERSSGDVVNLSGSAKLFPCVHLLIYPVQIILSVSITMSVFNESFRMYLLPSISKTWDEKLWGITCVVFSIGSRPLLWEIVCSLKSCQAFCWTSLISLSPEDAPGPCSLLWAWLPLDWLWGKSEGYFCALSVSWWPKSPHSMQCLPSVLLVLSNGFASSETVQDFGLMASLVPLCGIQTGHSDPWDCHQHWKGRTAKVNPSHLVW